MDPQQIELHREDVLPFYIGDDLTDDDAFGELQNGGITILVWDERRPAAAHYALKSPEEVHFFCTSWPNCSRIPLMNSWSLIYNAFAPEEEKLRESLCTVGNGYFCTRGAAPEAVADEVHYPGTYLAGGYNRLKSKIAGRTVENEDLVNMPNWLSLSFRHEDGDWFDLDKVEILSYRQELDMKRGLLLRSVRFREDEGQISELHQRCLVHKYRRHLAALETTLVAENWSGSVEFRSALDGRVANNGVARYQGLNNKHLRPILSKLINQDTILLEVQTVQSKLRLAQTARTRVFRDGVPHPVRRKTIKEPGYIAQHFHLHLAKGARATIEKVVALLTSRDEAISECGLAACKEVARAASFDKLICEHSLVWEHLWRRFGIEIGLIESEPVQRTQMILHLHIFHLLQTVSIHSIELDAGVPARGWHGEAYRGHIFWDELFIFPLLNLRMPEVTRALLKYRYRRLNEARAAARNAGFRGAMYPWQSGSAGREESQEIHFNPESGRWIFDNTRLQRHVNAAIAYNVWQYYQVTNDTEFLSFYGAEMILEIARFWASIATYNENYGRYEILGVMGPDEYHDAYPGSEVPGLNNNAYTNLMAVWVLCCALKVLQKLPDDRCRELCETMELEQEEIDLWETISRRMRLVFHSEGIISQFEGYDSLEELDWDEYRRKYGQVMRLDRILEAQKDTPNRYKCSKQADVLMLFYLFSADELRELFERLGYSFHYETIPQNIEYYSKRTCHGSTLSEVVHSWVLSRCDREGSWKLFSHALRSDIGDIQRGTTPEGIHLGAMAGTVDLVQRCYVGIENRAEVLWLNPRLPREISHLRLRLRYRGQSLQIEVTQERMKLSCLESRVPPVVVGFKGKTVELEGGERVEFTL